MLIQIGTAFGYSTRTHTLSRTLPRREASRCAARPQSAAQRARHGRDSRATRALSAVESTSSQVGFDQSDWSNPTDWAPSRRFSTADSTAPGSTRSVEWAQAGSTRSPHSTLPLWRVALSRGRLAAASGPPPRSDSTAATTCVAATSSAGPSYSKPKRRNGARCAHTRVTRLPLHAQDG